MQHWKEGDIGGEGEVGRHGGRKRNVRRQGGKKIGGDEGKETEGRRQGRRQRGKETGREGEGREGESGRENVFPICTSATVTL